MGVRRLFLILLIAPALAASTPAKKGEIERIKAKGTLRVATTAEDYPPFVYAGAGGKRAGVDVEIASAIAERLGVQLEWVNGASHAKVFEALKDGKADLAIAALYPTLDRLETVRFSEPYLRIPQVLFVQRVRATALKLPSGFDRIVARPEMVYGYFPSAGTADGMMRRELPGKWVPYARDASGADPRVRMIEDFAKGTLTAVWIDEIELEKWRAAKPNLDLHGFAVDVPSSDLPVAIALRRDSPELLEWVNLFIEQTGRSDVLKRIYRRHRAAAKSTPKGSD